MSEFESLARQEPLAAHISRHALDRLVMLCDGVFAIAITLAAIEIRLPEHHADFEALLGGMIGPLFAYAVSFVIIALFWMRSRDLFARVVQVDRVLTVLTLGQLCAVSLVPIGVRGIAELDSEAGFRLYCLAMFLAGLVSAALWIYAALRPGIMHAAVPRSYRFKRIASATLLAIIAGLLPFIQLAVSVRVILVAMAMFAIFRRIVGARMDKADALHSARG